MYARVIALLVSVGVLAAGKFLNGLIGEAAEAHVPQDNERGTKILAKFLETARSQHSAKITASKLAKAKALQEHAAAKKSSNKETKAAGTATAPHNNDGLVFDGYLIQRTRPNADCSGATTVVQGTHMSCNTVLEDTWGTETSIGELCFRDPVTNAVGHGLFVFDRGNCAYEPSLSLFEESFPKCSLDLDGFNDRSGFRTMSHQCTRNTDLQDLHAPGLLMSFHDDDQCSNAPSFFWSYRFGGCELVQEDDNSAFFYMRMNKCTSPGEVELVLYSDPSCLRPFARANSQFFAPDSMNNCAASSVGSEGFTMQQCVSGK